MIISRDNIVDMNLKRTDTSLYQKGKRVLKFPLIVSLIYKAENIASSIELVSQLEYQTCIAR